MFDAGVSKKFCMEKASWVGKLLVLVIFFSKHLVMEQFIHNHINISIAIGSIVCARWCCNTIFRVKLVDIGAIAPVPFQRNNCIAVSTSLNVFMEPLAIPGLGVPCVDP